MKNRNIVIFPFTAEQVSVLYVLEQEYPVWFQKYKIFGIVPNAYFSKGGNAASVLNRTFELPITLVGKEWIENAGPDDYYFMSNAELSQPVKEFAVKIEDELKKKRITVHYDLSCIVEEIRPEASRYKVIGEEGFLSQQKRLGNIAIPLIGIGAVAPGCDTAEIIAGLKDCLKEQMKVSTIYSGSGMGIWGLNNIDIDLLSSMSFEDKIYYVNWFIQEVIKREEPDILIVEIPGGLIKINSQYLNGGGEYPFVYSQAVTFDYIICSTPINDLPSFSFSGLKNFLQTKYGFTRISFHVSNRLMHLEQDHYEGNVPHTFVDEGYVNSELEKLRKKCPELPVYNLMRKEELVTWCSEQ